ncbi:MAG: GNAT family N-acetyltransferase [Rubricoccaceae bacterium]
MPGSAPDAAVQHQPARDRFVVPLGDAEAVLDYRRAGDGALAFTHTRVPETHEGQGIGSRLVEAGLAFARAEGLRVQPVCPFVAAYVREHAEHHDLLAPGYR